MAFHLGRPVLLLAGVAIFTGAAIALRTTLPRAQLVVWTFVDSHAQSYRGTTTSTDDSPIRRFEAQNHTTVDVDLVNVSAENIRLTAMFDRPTLDPNQPDVVEIEIGSVGRYLRAPIADIPFLPLNDVLARDGWVDRIVPSRFGPWSKGGIVFGFPHDLHPVSICYRRDLFEQAGVDLPASKTWPEFQENCLRFQQYWSQHGYPNRRAIELPQSTADVMVMMLLQRHINVLDDRDELHLDDPRVAQTIAFYAKLVAGDRAIGGETSPGGNLWVRDFVNGDVCALVTPDWRAGFLKKYGAGASGKVTTMPLPVFESRDAPTATWGGTMAAIPRRCRDPESAWKLLTFLYADRKSAEPRWRETMILPAIKDLWTLPAIHEPDPFFAGQRVGELYIELAKQIPPHYWSAFTPIANAQLVATLSHAIGFVNESDESLTAEVQKQLADESVELKRRIEFGKFE